MRFFTGSKTLPRLPVIELMERLIDDRSGSGAIDFQLSLDGKSSIKRNTDNWVRTWVDMEHRVEDNGSECIAYRAITDAGQLIWMVERPGRKYAYHADAARPEDAFRQASRARQNRRDLSRQWNSVKVLRRQVMLGSVCLTASLDDARNAGLCELGIQGFLSRIGCGGATHVSGRVLMLISYFDRQVSYPVFNAYLRKKLEDQTMAQTTDATIRQG